MFIETEETPNPNSLKFLPHRPLLKPRQTRSYMNVTETDDSPFAKSLFAVPSVVGVFIAHNFVAVTKDGASDWQDLRPALLSVMMDFFGTDQPVVLQPVDHGHHADVDDVITVDFDQTEKDVVDKIQQLLDERVQPIVAQDGGDIRFTKFRDGIVYLLLRGACAGCPSSTLTLKDGIENMLRYYIPEVQAVHSIAD